MKNNQVAMYQATDDEINIDVIVDQDSVWLTSVSGNV